MSHLSLAPQQVMASEQQSGIEPVTIHRKQVRIYSAALAAAMTREASLQTYYTIRCLVDAPLVDDAYRAYAYFRWVDDTLDEGQLNERERMAFLTRQKQIIARCFQGEWPENLCPEEKLVVDLVHSDRSDHSGLRRYIHEMMAVMSFDAQRKDRFISEVELAEYARCLATAVTEALHYFIGHDDRSPKDDTRYLAVTGAHITHMLRDGLEDASAGYYNIPKGLLESEAIAPDDVNHDAYRQWVRGRVKMARSHFASGRSYLARVENMRCRLAGYAYIARFEIVLDAIEQDGYRLRHDYPERKTKKARLKMIFSALKQSIHTAQESRNRYAPELIPSTEIGG